MLPLAPCGSIRVSIKTCCCPYVSSRSDFKSAEHKKSSSAAAWIFCMEPFCFGVTRGEQPLVRASRASKVAGAFLVLFWHAKENIPGGAAFCKNHETLNTRLRSAQETSIFPPFACAVWKTALRAVAGRQGSASGPAPAPGQSPICRRDCTGRCAMPPAGCPLRTHGS